MSVNTLPRRLAALFLLCCALFAMPAWAAVQLGNKTAADLFQDPQTAALAEAAASGRIAEVQRLVKAGAPVDGLGEQGITPLTFAMLASNLAGMEALLQAGANPNHKIDDKTSAGGRPIILLLARYKAAPQMELLLKYGADPNTREPVKAERASTAPYLGDSLLTLSVMNLESVKLLVRYGADVNVTPHPRAHSAGHASAAVVAARLGQFDALEFLLANGATHLDHIAHALQARTWAPFARARRLEILKLLKARGAHIYLAYKPSRSPHPENYPPQDTPADMISPGYFTVVEDTSDRPVDLNNSKTREER